MNIQMAMYNEGTFIISKDINPELLKDKKIGLRIMPVLRYRESNDVVGAIITVEYTIDKKQVLLYGGALSLHIEGWNEYRLKHSDESDLKAFIQPVWEYTLGVVRGILIEKTRDTILAHTYLPAIDLQEFAAAVQLELEQDI